MAQVVARSSLLTERLTGINVLVGLASSDWTRSGGLPLLLEEQKEGIAQMDTEAA